MSASLPYISLPPSCVVILATCQLLDWCWARHTICWSGLAIWLCSGVTVDLREEAGVGPDEFADLLGEFLDACEADGKRGVRGLPVICM